MKADGGPRVQSRGEQVDLEHEACLQFLKKG